VFIADGPHVSMPDTPENRASYPQPPTQQQGVGSPLARIAVLLSLDMPAAGTTAPSISQTSQEPYWESGTCYSQWTVVVRVIEVSRE
jgi:hypothetical protein